MKNKKGIWLICIGLLLIAAAIFLTTYNVIDEHLVNGKTQTALSRIAPTIEEAKQQQEEVKENAKKEGKEDIPEYILNPEIDMPTADIDGNKYIGMIRLPELELDLPVLSEWNYDNLKIAPCRYEGSAYKNNLILCSHNYDIHFGRIINLSIGADIELDDMDGNSFHYSVVEVEVVQPDEYLELIEGDWDLTLFTCTFGGGERIIVRCNLQKRIIQNQMAP